MKYIIVISVRITRLLKRRRPHVQQLLHFIIFSAKMQKLIRKLTTDM